MFDFGVAFTMGFVGSVHCVGMCGGFALLAGAGGGSPGRRIASVGLYVLGKTVTYAALGAILFEIVSQIPPVVSYVQNVILGLAGVFMVLVGVQMAGFGPNWILRVPRFASAFVSAFVSVMSGSVRRSSLGGRFLLGLFNGFLPCGLLYAALGYSVTMSSVLGSTIYMSVFGLGTAPALIVVSLGATLMSSTRRQSLYQALGWLVVVLGVATILRATPLMLLIMGGM